MFDTDLARADEMRGDPVRPPCAVRAATKVELGDRPEGKSPIWPFPPIIETVEECERP